MTDNLFKQLAELDVPPVPSNLDEQVHQRLNTTLLTTHLFDFAVTALPQAARILLQSVWYLIDFTITGQTNDLAENNESVD